MRTRTLIQIASVLTLGALSTGCAGYAFSGHKVNDGSIYADTQANEAVTDNEAGTKKGEACSFSVLGAYTAGDSSVSSAAKKGGIAKVSSVDNKFSNILGVYATYCVVVTGN
jgi:hypothetical protein